MHKGALFAGLDGRWGKLSARSHLPTTGALWPLWMELGAPAGVVLLLLFFNQGQGLVSVAPLSNGKFKHVQV